LGEHGHHMLALRREAVVERTGNRGLDDWIFGDVTVLRAVIRFLDIRPIGTNMNRVSMLTTWRVAGKAGVIRVFGTGDVDFAARARVIEMLHGFNEIGRKLFLIRKPEEGETGIEAGHDPVRVILGAIGKGYAGGLAILDQNS